MISISPHLLWEYDLKSFDFDSSKKIVIERIIQRGSLKEWQAMATYYKLSDILNVLESSKQLSPKDRSFTQVFLKSSLLYAV